jgi:FtsZ-interacting cell division protein ZipA
VRLLLILFVLLLVVAFVVGLFWPRRSRKAQEKLKSTTAKTAGTAEDHGGAFGDHTADAVRKGGRATQAAAHAGRHVRDELLDADDGASQDQMLEWRYGAGGSKGHGRAEPQPDQRDEHT